MAAVTAGVVAVAGTAYAANQSKKASKDQIRANEKAQGQIQQGVAQARQEVKPLFASAMDKSNQGYNNAINLLSGGTAPQANMMNQGNLAAQQSLLAGGQGYMNAILGSGGNPYAGLQTNQVQPDFSFLTNFVEQNQVGQPQPVKKQINPLEIWKGNQAVSGGRNPFLTGSLSGYGGGNVGMRDNRFTNTAI